MGRDISANKRKKSITKLVFVIVVNVIVAASVIFMSVSYSIRQNETRRVARERSFSSTLDVMGQVAYGFLHSEQVFCDNWANYINTRETPMNLDTCVGFVSNINTEYGRATAHFIDYDTFAGVAPLKRHEDGSVVPSGDETMLHVDYKEGKAGGVVDRVQEALENTRNCTQNTSHLHITEPFENPLDGRMSIGFCHNVNIVDENGQPKKKALIRVIPVTEFEGQWSFPTTFEDSKLALINSTGDFVIHFDSTDSNVEAAEGRNFFTYLREKTSVSDEQINKFIQYFGNTGAVADEDSYGELECSLNATGKEAFFSYHRLEKDKDWILVGYTLKEDLGVIALDTTLATIIIVGFCFLILFDGAYLCIMNRALKNGIEEIKKANLAKTRFLSAMSHDIRTPMNAIIGMTTIAAKRIDDKQRVEECLKQITRASNHLLTLINDVLDISKVESGKLTLNPTVFSLADLMANIVSIAQPHIKEKEMDFEIHARNVKHEYIFADELRINQILINLVSNSIKYTPKKGKVLLSVEERPSEKGCSMVQFVFTVTDTGIGMTDEFMKTMYDSFVRSVDSRINTIQGTGLGLAITKQMVDLMEGNIEAESVLGQGTTFTVKLDFPIAEKLTDSLILPPLKMLVVDDDEMFLESAEDTLVSLGLLTETANSGEEAVIKIVDRHDKGDDYQCVIVDWKMPDMSGLETVRAIREKVGDAVSIIIISAYDWTDIEEEAIKAGANGFISKPLFRSTVYRTLNGLLNLDHEQKTLNEDDTSDLEGVHLLIAEDNDVNWEIIQVMLEFHGITSERAENGQICVDKMNNASVGEFDAILMDIQMPVMNGKEACEEIRKSGKDYVKNIPIIAMTADAFAEDIAACKEAGMNGHVAKPLDMEKLIEELRSALNR